MDERESTQEHTEPVVPNPSDGPEASGSVPHPSDGHAESPEQQVPPSMPFHRRCPVTVWFSVLLIVIYGLSSFPNEFQAPMRWVVALGGFIPEAVADGQLWRFVTATLLHGHPSHLMGNVVGLLIFGSLLEPLIGSRRLLLLYGLSAVCGLTLSFFMLPGAGTYGASTIDYGLIGCYLSLILLLRFRQDRRLFWHELRGVLVFVLIFVLWDSLERATINMWGHLGGFLAGVVYAGWLLERTKQK